MSKRLESVNPYFGRYKATKSNISEVLLYFNEIGVSYEYNVPENYLVFSSIEWGGISSLFRKLDILKIGYQEKGEVDCIYWRPSSMDHYPSQIEGGPVRY